MQYLYTLMVEENKKPSLLQRAAVNKDDQLGLDLGAGGKEIHEQLLHTLINTQSYYLPSLPSQKPFLPSQMGHLLPPPNGFIKSLRPAEHYGVRRGMRKQIGRYTNLTS